MHGSQPKLSSVVESSVSRDLFLGFYRQDFDLRQQSQSSLEKTAKLWGRHHWFLRKMTFGNDCSFHTSDVVCHYPDLSSASDCNFPSAHDQSEALPRTGYWHLNSMKFLQSFLRRHFTGTQVVVSQNNSCFLRLFDGCSVQLMQGCHTAALFLMTPLYGDKLWWVEGTSPYKMWWTVYVRNNKLASLEGWPAQPGGRVTALLHRNDFVHS